MPHAPLPSADRSGSLALLQRLAMWLPLQRAHLLLVLAGALGCIGALATILFRECLRVLQWWLSRT
ncbi:chloride channel protein, partial [Azoarcus indigens]|nr:chloride channel protein [Azoarcus indigens]